MHPLLSGGLGWTPHCMSLSPLSSPSAWSKPCCVWPKPNHQQKWDVLTIVSRAQQCPSGTGHEHFPGQFWSSGLDLWLAAPPLNSEVGVLVEQSGKAEPRNIA